MINIKEQEDQQPKKDRLGDRLFDPNYGVEPPKPKPQFKQTVDLKASQKAGCTWLEGAVAMVGTADDGKTPILVMKRENMTAPSEQNKNNWSQGDTLYFKEDGSVDVEKPSGDIEENKFNFSCEQKSSGGFTDEQRESIEEFLKTKGYVESCTGMLFPELGGKNGVSPCLTNAELSTYEYPRAELKQLNSELFADAPIKFLYKRIGKDTKTSGSETERAIKELQDANWITDIEYSKLRDEQRKNYCPIRLDLDSDYKKDFPNPYTMFQPCEDVDCNKAFNKTFPNISWNNDKRSDCRSAIDLYHLFFKTKGCNMERANKTKLKTFLETKCKNINFRGGTEKKWQELINTGLISTRTQRESVQNLKQSIHENLVELKKLKENKKMKESNIKKNIHESLLEIKNNKKIQILESNILKTRFDFIIESHNEFKNDIKLLKDLIYEFDYIKKQNFSKTIITENESMSLINYVSDRLGPEKLENAISKMVKSISKKLDGNENTWWVDIVTKKIIENKPSAQSFFEMDCDYIVDSFKDALSDLLRKRKNGSPLSPNGISNDDVTELFRNNFDDSIKNWFEINLKRDLKRKICPILAKFLINLEKEENELNSKLMKKKDMGGGLT